MKLDPKVAEEVKKLYREGLGDGRIVTYKGKKYEVKGDQRLTIFVVGGTAKKAAKAAAADESVKCDTCGELFLRSRFTPYFTSCPKCRKGTGKTTVEVCKKCGKKYDRSVYMPYVDKCPDCRKAKKTKAA